MSFDNDYWSYINRHDNFGISSCGYSSKLAHEAERYAYMRVGYSNEAISRMCGRIDAIDAFMDENTRKRL